MRIFRIVIVVIVLLGFPFISWLYLRSGLQWRRQAEKETAVKGKLSDFALVGMDTAVIGPGEIFGKFCVFADPKDSTAVANLNKIQKQFGERSDFRTIYVLPSGGTPLAGTDPAVTTARCETGCATLQQILFDSIHSAAIVDDSLRVRGRYVLSSAADVDRLVKHIAVVLPIKKRETLELKRGDSPQ